MKQIIRIDTIVFLTLLISIVTARGATTTHYSYPFDLYSDGIYYKKDSETRVAAVTCYEVYIYANYSLNPSRFWRYKSNYSGNVVIPETVTHNDTTYIVTKISEGAFEDTDVGSITIPKTITNVSGRFCYGCSVRRIYCYAEETPEFNCNSQGDFGINVQGVANFRHAYARNITLFVPKNSVEQYRSHPSWGLFNVETLPTIISFADPAVKDICVANWDTDGDSELSEKEAASVTSIELMFRGQDITSFDELQYFTGLTNIADSAFYSCNTLTSIIIPESVTMIGKSAFSYCPKLRDVYCYAEIVPNTDSNAFYNSNIASATLHVPAESMEQYKTTKPWSEFGEIISIDNLYTLTYIVDGDIYKTYEVEYNSPITPEPEPTKEGYTFSGWSEIPGIMPEENITVTGTFTVNSYILTYMVDGEVYKTNPVAYGTELTPEPAPIREGYTFSGWSYIPGTMPATDVVVMGTFTINSYTLTYMVDGEEYKTSTVVYGSEITPEAEPTKEGYTFSGWSEIPENMPAGDVVVTGSFIPNSYTLSYIVDGEEYKTASVTYGTAITPEAEPIKEGYTFSGWSEIPNTMPAEDVTVTGSFTINQYLLTYILEGEEYKSYEIDFNTALTPEPVPTKKGMTFSGWGDVPETMPAHNVTLTGSYTWSKEVVDDVVYQVADTLSNYASVVGYEGTGEEVTILSDVLIGEDVYAVNNIAENALPKTTTIYVSAGRLLLWLWTNGYEDIRDTDSGRCLPAPEISLEGKTASSLSLSYKNDYPQFSETITLQGSPVEKGKKGYDLALTGLEPDKLYEGLATLTLTYEETSYSKSFSFKTEPLTLTTQQPKIISLGNVIVAATSNLDDAEMNVGFEWRRTDWTDDFASNFGKAYLYKGTMEGYIRNLYIEKLWKYRPYYESNDGNRYYGNWVGIDPTNTSYFMPTVHTYSRINLLGNLAEIWGYVMRGTDNITMQGFIYWSISSTSSSRRNANGIPSDATKVLATGNVMSATLEDLDYDTEYCYMAFVTTSEGETFYGEPQTFKTSFDPDGIENVMASEEVTEVARYDIQGRMISKPQKGINIIRFSDGTTRKVIVKQ